LQNFDSEGFERKIKETFNDGCIFCSSNSLTALADLQDTLEDFKVDIGMFVIRFNIHFAGRGAHILYFRRNRLRVHENYSDSSHKHVNIKDIIYIVNVDLKELRTWKDYIS
jgi:hypothetical protein